ncbi:MAG: KpsF/GutQ family sugar-phosphate isomerase [Deferribacteraceae bacterium]|jgi:arabinose-5-phosphate isomerase|nr:KpsF/GutQ family sugar-phosphate isomerase [Deferribacteraceae bacterium]
MSKILDIAVKTFDIEIEGLEAAKKRIDAGFERAVELIISSKGRLAVTGMGKSGHIARKIAATLSSTGTPAFFIHPAEAVHGDMGMLVKGDVVLALSKSGETEEIKAILPLIKRLGYPLISITGNPASTLAKKSDAHLDGSVEREACSLNLAPTSSTTLSLVLGDALAVALMQERSFTDKDFALYHPSGALGNRLYLRVADIWHTGSDLPVVKLSTPMKDLLYIISSKRFGCAAVIDGEGKLAGIVTDGDLRRCMEKYENYGKLTAAAIMTRNPKVIAPVELAISALELMGVYSITTLLSVDAEGKPVGIIHMHDLIRRGLEG